MDQSLQIIPAKRSARGFRGQGGSDIDWPISMGASFISKDLDDIIILVVGNGSLVDYELLSG